LLAYPLTGSTAVFGGFLSELAADDQPHRFLFRGCEVVSGMCVLVLALRARVLGRHFWWGMLWTALAAFSLCTLLDVIFTMDCAPTLSAECRALERSGAVSLKHRIHTLTSSGAQAGINISLFAALFLSRVTLARSGAAAGTTGTVGPGAWTPARRKRLRLVVFLLTLGQTLALAVCLIMYAARIPGVGVAQAVAVLLASIWFLVFGRVLAQVDPAPAPVTGTTR